MKNSKNTSRAIKVIPVLGIVAAVVFWVFDTVIDIYVFDEGQSFLENFISPEPTELWMRFLVVTMLLVMASYTSKILSKQQNILNKSQLFAEIGNNMTEGAYLIRVSDGIILYTNPAFEKMFGYKHGEMKGQHVSIVNAPSKLSPIEAVEVIRDELIDKGVWRGEVKNIKKDGTAFWCSSSVTTFNHAEHGDVWLAVHTDITLNREKEDLLQASEQRFTRIAQAAPIGIFQTDANGQCIFINEGYQKIAKIQESDALGDGWANYIHPDDKEMVFEGWVSAVKENRPFVMDYRQCMPDESYIWVHCMSQAETGDDNEILSYLGTIQDITEQVELNAILQRTQKMDALGKLTGGIAHDFNNMLGIVMGYSDLLTRGLDDNPKLKKYAQEIGRAGLRGTKLTKKLLSFSNKKNADNETININTLLSDEKHMLEKTLTARIQLKLNLADDLWLVNIDSGDLEDAIVNLSINAMHAIESSGDLTINTSNVRLNELESKQLGLATGDYVLLSIEDTGCGIDDDSINRIFEPFFSTKGNEGTGLGLSQVYGFVERSKGIIKVSSELDKGTCFSLYFPRNCGDEDSSQDFVDRSIAVTKGSETILVVDDEPALLELTGEILEQQGYEVIVASSGKQALDILATQAVDLLLSDIVMPEMDGYQLARTVQEKYPAVKIQLASGYNDGDTQGIIKNTSYNKILNKPYDSSTLQNVIREKLDS